MGAKIHLINGDLSLVNQIYNNKTNDINYIANNEQELKEIINELDDDKYSIVYYNHNDRNRLVYNETQFINTKLRFNKNYCKPKSNICIVIKIDNNLLSDFENLCLNQLRNIYHNHDIFIITSNENSAKELSNKFANNVIYYDVNCVIDNDVNFYKLFQDRGYEWMLYISNLNTYVYQDSLDEFTNLGYDTFGASVEPFFYKKLIHAYDTTYNLRKIETHKQLCSILSTTEKNGNLIDNVYKHIDLFNIPPKELQYIFAVKDFPEQQYDVYQRLPLAAINPFNYVNEYNYPDGYQFDNELYIEYENDHSFYKKHNIDNWTKQNIYHNEVNLSKFKKQLYEEVLYKFMYKATFPDFEKVNSLLKNAEYNNQIPKLVHFCFLGWNDLPEKNKICILSWIEKLETRGYMFINWTPVLLKMQSNIWLNKCIEHKKWAFFADYIRVFALYNYGGIYMDADILVNKPFDELLDLDYVFDKEISPLMDFRLEAGCMLSKKHNTLLEKILYFYDYEIIYPENDNFWENNYKYDSYIMPNLINGVIKDNKFEVVYNIDNIAEYRIRQQKDKKSIHVLNSKFLSSPKMQRSGYAMYDRNYTFSSHCFTNSYC